MIAFGDDGAAAARDLPDITVLEELVVSGTRASPTSIVGEPPPPYAGGQVARGQRVGLLGNRSYLDTPFSGTSYTEQYIRDQQARTLSEILASDPSVRVTTPRFGFSDQISVRGFTLNGADATLDGIGGIVPPRRLPFDSIERVELIRGPGTLLTGVPAGSNIGGTLNYVPKRALDLPIARVTTGFISDGNLGTAVDVGRRFGPNNAWGLRINGSFRDGPTPLAGETERLGNLALALDYRGDGVRMSLDGGTFDFYQQKYSQVVLSLAPGARAPRAPSAGTTLSPTWQRAPIQGAYGLGRIEVDLGENATLGIGYGRSYTSERTVQTYLTNLRTNGDVTATPAMFPYWSRNDGFDAGVRTRFDTGPLSHHLAVTGNVVAIERSLSTVAPLGPVTTQNVYRPFTSVEPAVSGIDVYPAKTGRTLLASAGIADVISAFDERVQLTIGVRRQRIENESYAIATGARTARQADDAFAPAYGILVKPTQFLSLYANAVEGLVQGLVAPLGASNAGQFLAPAKARQLELGAKLDLGGFGAQMAVFQIAQQTGALDATTNFFAPVGRQRNQGAEFQVFGEAMPGLRLLGGVAFIDGRLLATSGGIDGGRKAPGVPDWQVSFQVEYDLSFLPGLTLSGRVLATDRVFFDVANTQTLPGWTRFDLGLRYTTLIEGRPVALRAAVENIADVSYWQAAGRSLLSLGSPRVFLLSATFDL